MKNIKVGDTVWIYGAGSSDNKLCPATVEHIFSLWGYDHYVVSVSTSIDPVLYIRDGFTISDDPNKPINMWRKSK